MQTGQPGAAPRHFAITMQQLTELTEIAGELSEQAQRCREAGLWSAALIHLAGSAEAALLATICIFEPELRNAGLWRPPKGDPTRWTLGQLAGVARDAGWLPVQPATAGHEAEGKPSEPAQSSDDLFACLDGQIGDAMKFVEQLRNMIVHPGAFVRAPIRPDVSDEDHMRPTYDLIQSISDLVIERLHAQLQTLPD